MGKKQKENVNTEETKSTTKNNNMIVIIMSIAIIGFIAGGGFFAVKYLKSEIINVIETNNKPNNTPAKPVDSIVKAYHEIGEIFVNLNEANRYVKLNISLSYDSSDEKIVKEIPTKVIELKDATNFYFKSLLASDFSSSNEKKLKENLLIKLNELMSQGQFIDVLITDILLQ